MAEKSGFFNAKKLTNGNYDKTYLAEDFREYFINTISNGVFLNTDNNALKVTGNSVNFTLNINMGKAHIKGCMYNNTTPLQVILDSADPTLDRIDRVVLRLDEINRNITIQVLKGTYSSLAVAKKPTQNVDIHELVLADVYVARGITYIDTARNIRDCREDKTLCGTVTCITQQPNLQDIYSKYVLALDKFKTENTDITNFLERVTNLENRVNSTITTIEPTVETARVNTLYFIPEVM